MATADQPTARQTAPAAPSVAPNQLERMQHQVGVQTSEQDPATTAPGLSLTGTAPDVSHEITIDTTESDGPAPIDLDPQAPGTDATLSDLDRIGLRTRVIRTTRASGAIKGGEQPTTWGIVDHQPPYTSQDRPDLFGDTDLSGVDILDIDVDGSEDFSDIDPEMVDELLGGGPEEMIKNWVAGCNRGMTDEQGPKTQPKLGNGPKSLELADEAVFHAIPSADCAQSARRLCQALLSLQRREPLRRWTPRKKGHRPLRPNLGSPGVGTPSGSRRWASFAGMMGNLYSLTPTHQ